MLPNDHMLKSAFEPPPLPRPSPALPPLNSIPPRRLQGPPKRRSAPRPKCGTRESSTGLGPSLPRPKTPFSRAGGPPSPANDRPPPDNGRPPPDNGRPPPDNGRPPRTLARAGRAVVVAAARPGRYLPREDGAAARPGLRAAQPPLPSPPLAFTFPETWETVPWTRKRGQGGIALVRPTLVRRSVAPRGVLTDRPRLLEDLQDMLKGVVLNALVFCGQIMPVFEYQSFSGRVISERSSCFCFVSLKSEALPTRDHRVARTQSQRRGPPNSPREGKKKHETRAFLCDLRRNQKQTGLRFWALHR